MRIANETLKPFLAKIEDLDNQLALIPIQQQEQHKMRMRIIRVQPLFDSRRNGNDQPKTCSDAVHHSTGGTVSNFHGLIHLLVVKSQ
jgi:hypothetical protein